MIKKNKKVIIELNKDEQIGETFIFDDLDYSSNENNLPNKQINKNKKTRERKKHTKKPKIRFQCDIKQRKKNIIKELENLKKKKRLKK